MRRTPAPATAQAQVPPLREWLALALMLGMCFQTAAGALVMVKARSAERLAVYSLFLCHARPDGQASGRAESDPSDCCLLCQATQMANGGAPPQHFTHPTRMAASFRFAVVPADVARGSAAWRQQARAPPVMAAL